MYRKRLYLALLICLLGHYRNRYSMKTPSKLPTSSVSLRDERNARIRADFQNQYERGQRVNFILKDLSGRYFLAEDTLERIVFERGYYRQAATVGASSALTTA